jgi:hypothetical protein
MKEKPVQLFECPEEKVPQQPGHRYGSETRKQQFVEQEGRPIAHRGDWPACHAEIFLVLRKKKIAAGKKLQIDVLCCQSFSNSIETLFIC